MHKKYFYISALVISMLSFSCQKNQESNNETSNEFKSSLESNSSSDMDFIRKIGMANKSEVAMGQLALSKSNNRDVKEFAQLMVKEHTQAQNDLKKLAKSKNMTLPDSLDETHKSAKERLQRLSGSEFDNEYVQAQLEGHKKVLKEFEDEIANGKDKEVVEFANKYKPHIKMHLDKIKSIQETVSKK